MVGEVRVTRSMYCVTMRAVQHHHRVSVGLQAHRFTSRGMMHHLTVPIHPSSGLPLSRAVDNGCTRSDEENASSALPCYGLSLSRLCSNTTQSAAPTRVPTAAVAASMTRAFSVNDVSLAAAGASAAASLVHHRRAQMYRSHSYIGPDTLPMDFDLGACGSSGAFGARGRSVSLNETQLRRQWLNDDCALLAPQLPPSVSELELLELPEDAMPLPSSRPQACLFVPDAPICAPPPPHQQQQQPVAAADAGLTQFAGVSPGATDTVPAQPAVTGTAPTVKRKIITSPSPLLQGRQGRQRQAAARGGAAGGAQVVAQSPKRVKVGANGAAVPAPWQQQEEEPSSAGVLAGWQPAARGAGAGMKAVRSVPANMNAFLEGYDVTVRAPASGSGAVAGAGQDGVSPNSSAASASTPLGGQQPFVRAFAEPGRPAAAGQAGVFAAPGAKAGSKGRVAMVPPPPMAVPGMVGPDGETGIGLR